MGPPTIQEAGQITSIAVDKGTTTVPPIHHAARNCGTEEFHQIIVEFVTEVDDIGS